MMNVWRILGILLVVFGLFFACQGSGLIMWPSSSFMLAQSQWIVYGLGIALIGGALIWFSRR